MKRVCTALALAGVVTFGAAKANVVVPLLGRPNPLTFRDSVDPISGLQGRIEYTAFKDTSRAFNGGHVFSSVLKRVYEKNGGITLSPDVMLFLVAKHVAEHVAASGEKYRNLFTSKQSGKETIMLEDSTLRLGAHDNDWSGVLPRFVDELSTRIQDSALAGLFMHDFSTSTPLDKACGAVVLMHAAQNFYQPEVMPRSYSCGPAIAAVKVKGTQTDWQRLSGKIMSLGNYFPDLQGHLTSVAVIANECAESFNSIDKDYWQQMYFDGGQGWIKTLLSGTGNEMTSTGFQWGAAGPQMKFVCGVLSYTSDDEDFLEPSLGYSVVYQ